MSTPNDDAQRDMEQRALRNVRALVDKYEDKDAAENQATKRFVVGFVVALAVIGLGLLAYLQFTPKSASKTLVLPPPASTTR